MLLKKIIFFKQEKDNESLDIVSAYVHITDSCNLHCIGCYSYIKDRNDQKDLSFHEICNMFKKLKQANLKKVVISGGEPFNRNDFIEICKFIKSLGIEILVITNGTKDLELYEKAIKYIDEISVSVDGYNSDISFIRDNGIMPKVLDTINHLKDKIPTKMIITLYKKNVKFMGKYFELSNILKVPFNFSILTVEKDNKAFKDFILDSNDYIIINEFKLGNIIKQELNEIILSESNKFFDMSVDKIEGCNKCKYKYLCGGSCRARAYLENKTLYKTDSFCEVSYLNIDSQVKIMKEVYELN